MEIKQTKPKTPDNEIVVVEIKFEYCYKCGGKMENGFCRKCKKARQINSSTHYLAQISLKGATHDTIKIKTIKKYLPLAEYIVMKKKFEGWFESKSKALEMVRNEGFPPLEVITITIEKLPVLKGIREELTRGK